MLKCGRTILPQARAALEILNGRNKRGEKVPYVFITNGGGLSELGRARLMEKELGLEVSHKGRREVFIAGG